MAPTTTGREVNGITRISLEASTQHSSLDSLVGGRGGYDRRQTANNKARRIRFARDVGDQIPGRGRVDGGDTIGCTIGQLLEGARGYCVGDGRVSGCKIPHK